MWNNVVLHRCVNFNFTELELVLKDKNTYERLSMIQKGGVGILSQYYLIAILTL